MVTPIIVVNWNGIEDTVECIESLLNMTFQRFKIFLIDNGSKNQEGDRLKKIYSDNTNILVYINFHNLGFAAAHNKLWFDTISNLNTPYIALLNNDTIVDENWLENLLKFADFNKIDIVSSKMIDYSNRQLMDNAGHKILNTGEILPIGSNKPIEKYNKPIENIGACAGACLYRTSMIRHIGFFDLYFNTGYEDAEFGLRAFVAGYKCKYNPKAIIYHKRGKSIKKIFNLEYSVMIQTSIFYTYFKLFPLGSILLSLPFIVLKNILVFLIHFLFRKWKTLYVYQKSWYKIFKELPNILKQRRYFYRTIDRNIGFYAFTSKTIFFLPTDISRFWNIFVLKRGSSIDKY